VPDAFDILAHPEKHPAESVCVLYGDESFLKREVLAELRRQVLGEEDGQWSLTTFAGPEATLRDVLDEMSTVAMFGAGRRLVVIDDADDFVSRNRAALEEYVANPKPSAVLVLEVKTWPSNTRLAKAVAEKQLSVECKFPSPAKLLKWIVGWAKRKHHATLEPAAAEMLTELVEPELGLFDQELAKLAAVAGKGGTITLKHVEETVGTWRTRTVWDMLDAAVSGRPSAALVELDRLLLAGEAPIALLAQIGSTLRRFAAATRIIEQAETVGRRIILRQALEEAGFKPFAMGKAEAQLRQIGRARAGRLYRWLLEADLALKGTSSSPPRARLVLEQLVVRIGSPEHAAKKLAAR